MANPESDVEKLQLSLAGAALLACEEKIDPGAISLEPHQIARLLGYEGDFERTDEVRTWLTAFFNGPVASKVAKRMQNPRHGCIKKSRARARFAVMPSLQRALTVDKNA